MRLKHFDLVVAIIIALGNLLWATLSHHHPQIIGILLALPQVFLLPGYTLIEFLFHRRPLENVRRLVLSISLSIAIAILSGFILQKFWSISTISWAVYLSSLTIIMASATVFRRTGHRVIIINRKMLMQLYTMLRRRIISVALLLTAIGLAIIAVAYSSYSVTHERRSGFSQLWIVQDNPKTKSCAVLIGVDSFEFTTTKYHILVTTYDVPVITKIKGVPTPPSTPVTSTTPTSTWSSPVHLSPQKSWKVVRQIDAKGPGDTEVMVQLYLAKKPTEIYRYVHLILHSTNGTSAQSWQCTT